MLKSILFVSMHYKKLLLQLYYLSVIQLLLAHFLCLIHFPDTAKYVCQMFDRFSLQSARAPPLCARFLSCVQNAYLSTEVASAFQFVDESIGELD